MFRIYIYIYILNVHELQDFKNCRLVNDFLYFLPRATNNLVVTEVFSFGGGGYLGSFCRSCCLSWKRGRFEIVATFVVEVEVF